jgi:hypothetical protein
VRVWSGQDRAATSLGPAVIPLGIAVPSSPGRDLRGLASDLYNHASALVIPSESSHAGRAGHTTQSSGTLSAATADRGERIRLDCRTVFPTQIDSVDIAAGRRCFPRRAGIEARERCSRSVAARLFSRAVAPPSRVTSKSSGVSVPLPIGGRVYEPTSTTFFR